MHPFDTPPPPAIPPSDPELQKIIDKLAEYSAKNGPEFEAMIREKQKDNPDYSFLFGGEGHNYYRYKLWLYTHPQSFPLIAPPPMHQPSVPPPYFNQPPPYYDPSVRVFKGLSGPLPSDVAAELNGVLSNLTGTKESIRGAKMWFMQRAPFAPALAEALRERIFAIDDSEGQLHIIFLANDILFESLQRRANLQELDNEALAFKPVLGSMLARVYHNPHNMEANRSRLEKILQFWASKEVYDQATIASLEREMFGGQSLHAAPRQEMPAASFSDPSTFAGQPPPQWQQPPPMETNPQEPIKPPPSGPSSMFSAPPAQPPQQPASPYPLFPPGLIPGMVRKTQIGSGVPYSPLSPLDIPTIIPPSTITPSEIQSLVSKFFKEINEPNPSMGSAKGAHSDNVDYGDNDDDVYEREKAARKGGACIPPPASLQKQDQGDVDPDTGMYPDGSVERKSGSGRLGLGAAADPNEVSQYDDVYSSYRKHRSTNYHSSMSARATTR